LIGHEVLHFLGTGKGKPNYFIVMTCNGHETPQGIVQSVGLQDGNKGQGVIICPCLAKEGEQGAPALTTRVMLAYLP